MSDDVLVRVDGLSKKFSRAMKQSMLYGMYDIMCDFAGIPVKSDQLRKTEFWALQDISFELKRGECLGLIGANGSGKSSLLKLINGIFMPDKGTVEVKGRTGALIELGAGFHPMLSGRENIYISGAILGLSKKEIDENFNSIVEFSELEDFIDTPVKFYSSGMYVRLGFAVAIHLKPDVLLVDEVLAVGDLPFQAKCLNSIGLIREQGTGIILVSHNMHRISGFCDRAALMKEGDLEYIGDVGEAVALYVNRNLQHIFRDSSGERVDMESIKGTGDILINDIIFKDKDGRQTDYINCGEPLTILLLYESSKTVKDPFLDVTVRDSSPGNLFQVTNRDYNFQFGEISGKGALEIHFDRIDANNQVLNFFFTFWNSEHTVLFDWKRHVKLMVRGHPMSSGRMMWKCSWNLASPSKECELPSGDVKDHESNT